MGKPLHTVAAYEDLKITPLCPAPILLSVFPWDRRQGEKRRREKKRKKKKKKRRGIKAFQWPVQLIRPLRTRIVGGYTPYTGTAQTYPHGKLLCVERAELQAITADVCWLFPEGITNSSSLPSPGGNVPPCGPRAFFFFSLFPRKFGARKLVAGQDSSAWNTFLSS